MITNNITLILYITGGITALPLLVFVAPRLMFKALQITSPSGDLHGLIERHWGMSIFITGLLLLWSAYDPAIRTSVLTCVALNKAAFVGVMVMNRKVEQVWNFAPAIIFDTACVAIYLLYLTGLA